MALKLTNNATSRLATSLSNSDTTVVLSSGDGAKFPSLSAGDWFPITVVRSDTQREIMYATARASDVLTVERGKEGTAPIAFLPNDMIELRATAGVFAAYLPILGGTLTGALTVIGDITTKAGKVALDEAATRYLAFDGTQYTMPGAGLLVDGSAVLTEATLNMDDYLARAGGTMTGTMVVQNTAPMISMHDTDWTGVRSIYSKGGNIGFTQNDGSWAAYSLTTGAFVATGDIGAYSDRRHKRNIVTINDGLSLIERLRGVRYVRKSDGERRVGLIAQEVREVLPEVVGDSPDGLYVDYGKMVGPLIEAVKELAARVRRLERTP